MFFKRRSQPEDVAPEPAPRVRSVMPPRRQRMMEGAATDRFTSSWQTTPMHADDIVRLHQRALVARSREQAANNDYGKAFLRMVSQNIVGADGIRLQAQSRDPGGSLDQVANDAIEAAFSDWSRRDNCDVAGRNSLRMMQDLAVKSAARDGEFMFRWVFGRDAGPYGVALQHLDPQRCPVDFDRERSSDGSFVRHGIEFNKYGRPLAYFFTTLGERDADYRIGGRAFLRVPADEIIHGFRQEMPGQKRGIPWMATSLWRMRMLHGYEQATLVNARVSAAKGGFFKSTNGGGIDREDSTEPIQMDAEPGVWYELPEGVEPVASHPPYPTNEFAPFRKEMLRAMSTGFGVAYNNLANDLENVNFSSIRQGALDERDGWKSDQSWLMETLLEPIFSQWLPRALLAGLITIPTGGTLKAERLAKYRDHEWQARRWEWIDPRADVTASIEEQRALLGSAGGYIRDQGQDPQSVWRAIAQDIEQMRAAGIPENMISMAMGLGMQVAGQSPQGGENGA